MSLDLDLINYRADFNKLTKKEQKEIIIKHNILIFARLLCWGIVNYFIFNSSLKPTNFLLVIYLLMDIYELVCSVVLRKNVRGFSDLFSFLNKLIYNPIFFILATIIPFWVLGEKLVKFIKLLS